MTTLSVSIVVHESCLAYLDATLRSLDTAMLRARDSAVLASAIVTVLDNASSADYGARLQQRIAAFNATASEAAALVMHADNAGYGAGHNAAQRDATADLLLILNPDTELCPDALTQALEFLASREDVVALNPRCVGSDGAAEYLCKRYPSLLVLLLRALPVAVLRRRFARYLADYEYRDLDPDRPAPVRLLSGACLLCRRSAFAALGGFDERYFMYFEDFDLSLRLAERGAVFYLPSMRIVHHGGYAARKGLRHSAWFLQSALRFFRGHGWRLR